MEFDLKLLKSKIEIYVQEFIKDPPNEVMTIKRPEFLDKALNTVINGAYTTALLNDLITQRVDTAKNVDRDNPVGQKLLCLKKNIKTPKELSYNTYKIDKNTMVHIHTIFFGKEEDDVLKTRLEIENEFAIRRKAGELGVATKCIDAYICSSGGDHFKVIYSEYPANAISLRKYLYEGRTGKTKLSKAARDDAKLKFQALIKKLHANNIIYSVNNGFNTDDIYVVPKGNTIDKIYLNNFSKAININQSKTAMIKKDLDIDPFYTYAPNSTSRVFEYVFGRLIANKDIVFTV